VERTTIAGETEELGENLPQRHFVPPQIPHDQVRFRTPDRSGGKPATNRLSYGAASSGAYDQIFITVRQLRVCRCVAFSLTRGRVCRLQFLLALASAVIFGSEPRETRDHCLRLKASLSVISYGSQGYGGGIRPRLHTGLETKYSVRTSQET
jgi:hypothetical protein